MKAKIRKAILGTCGYCGKREALEVKQVEVWHIAKQKNVTVPSVTCPHCGTQYVSHVDPKFGYAFMNDRGAAFWTD